LHPEVRGTEVGKEAAAVSLTIKVDSDFARSFETGTTSPKRANSCSCPVARNTGLSPNEEAHVPPFEPASTPNKGCVQNERTVAQPGRIRTRGSMAKRSERTVLFLCTGNYYRSRFAEALFNSVAGKMGLPWRASSRGLALERGANNVGPMAASAIRALEAHGVSAAEAVTRLPAQVTADDLEGAALIVALKHAEHLPLLQERFPAWAEKAEFWHVDDAPEVLGLIEHEVMGLVARLLGGGRRPENRPNETAIPASPPVTEPAKKPVTLKVGRETAGRRGKGVTTVFDLPFDEGGVRELAALLKHRCGTGGTVKGRRIEIQGDQRERIAVELERLGYRVKRVGG
jgi:predicted translation initiation factor SUI1